MPSKQNLIMQQALPLEIKILKTKQRIKEWVEFFGLENVYVSFSGGKDSTVLLDIARSIYPTMTAVFVNTGLEYPEIVTFVKSFENVTILHPKMNFKDVITKYGYPFISKEVSQNVGQARMNQRTGKYSYRLDKLNGTAINKKTGELSQYNCPKYKPMLHVDFIISHECCNVMKKIPFKSLKGMKAIIGSLASESKLREKCWINSGCNAFENKKQVSNPLSPWMEQDILQYIKLKNILIPSVYGTIYETANKDYNQMCIDGCGNRLCTSGCQRTGCIFCGFGAHLDTLKGGVSRFELLRKSHPKLFDYCMRGGKHVDGIWQPTNHGLGMAYVINELNKLYDKKLKNNKIKKFIDVDVSKYINEQSSQASKTSAFEDQP